MTRYSKLPVDGDSNLGRLLLLRLKQANYGSAGLCATVAITLLMLVNSRASGALVERDLVAAGDKQVTVDQTQGLSADQALADVGSDAFSIATLQEVEHIYDEFGITDLSGLPVAENLAGGQKILDAMGRMPTPQFPNDQIGWVVEMVPPPGAANFPVGFGRVRVGSTLAEAAIIVSGGSSSIISGAMGTFVHRPAKGLTIVDVTYESPADPNGPISLGLESLPEEIPARFVIDGVRSPTGITTFDENDVIFAELTIRDGTWTVDDLVDFIIQIELLSDEEREEEPCPTATAPMYEMAGITTTTAIMRPVLNHSFQLQVSGTDIARAEDFDYLHQDSVQQLTSSTPGDFEVDGDVDGIDMLVWQLGASPDPLSQTDLQTWEANYGTAAALAAAVVAVPEPSAMGLALIDPLSVAIGGTTNWARFRGKRH